MATVQRDWAAWHDAYADPDSALSRRLAVVRQQIWEALPGRPREPVRIVSLCAGRGDDLIGVLKDYSYASRVEARLIELDARNVAAMTAAARTAGLSLEIVRADAADPRRYHGAIPADLVLLCGVLGNVSDQDALFTVRSLPQLCKRGATVIWTRSRREPDLTPQIRRAFRLARFTELAFIAPDDVLFTVGVSRFDGEPQPLSHTKLFTFVR